MQFTNIAIVHDWKHTEISDLCIQEGKISNQTDDKVSVHGEHLVAYPALINVHDHLVGNWLPKGAPNRPYKNTSIWVDDMRDSEPVKERDRVWKGSLDDLMKNGGDALALLGVYKNIFSGVVVVQDHIPNQIDRYYEEFPITVIKEYRQGHSLKLQNWWGGESLEDEMLATQQKIPFVIHVAEGDDHEAKQEFDALVNQGLLCHNSLLVHCTALTDEQWKQVADARASVAWCPNSNLYLLQTTLHLDAVLNNNINLCLGTDSTLSGSVNLLEELRYTHQHYPQLSPQYLLKMVTENPACALMLSDYNGTLTTGQAANVLITKQRKKDPYENLLEIHMDDIELLLHQGKPVYGNVEFLKYFSWKPADFFMFDGEQEQKFVAGHPEQILQMIERKLGHEKHFDYLPFSLSTK